MVTHHLNWMCVVKLFDTAAQINGGMGRGSSILYITDLRFLSLLQVCFVVIADLKYSCSSNFVIVSYYNFYCCCCCFCG